MKKLLAALLVLVLALSLALPAMAAVNWNEFRITKEPRDITIKYGDSFTLSVEVRVPEGVEAEYEWYSDGKIENATAPELRLGPYDPKYPEYTRLGGDSTNWGGATTRYRCEITAYEKDEAGNIVSSRSLSAYARVSTERTFLGILFNLAIVPFEYAFGTALASSMLTLGLLLPVSPVIFLFGLVFGFFNELRMLF